jgi:dolichol-phosphate mannosyltransferase
MVIGSVHLNKEGLGSYPFFRRLLSRWANFYCRKILGYGLKDWTNNFVAIRASLLRKLDLTKLGAKEFAFVFSLRFSLLKLGASWKEIPVVIKTRNKGKSKMKFSTMAEAAVVPWKLRFKLE